MRAEEIVGSAGMSFWWARDYLWQLEMELSSTCINTRDGAIRRRKEWVIREDLLIAVGMARYYLSL